MISLSLSLSVFSLVLSRSPPSHDNEKSPESTVPSNKSLSSMKVRVSPQACVIRHVVFLDPEAELQGILKGPIRPWNGLIGIQEGPHVVACQLTTRVVAKVTSGIPGSCTTRV